MDFRVIAHDLELTDSLRSHVERHLQFALTRFHDEVRRVHVRLADVNGPKGGIDIECKVRAELGRSGELIVCGKDRDPFRVVARVTDRVAQALSRRLGRRKRRGRGHGLLPAPTRPTPRPSSSPLNGSVPHERDLAG